MFKLSSYHRNQFESVRRLELTDLLSETPGLHHEHDEKYFKETDITVNLNREVVGILCLRKKALAHFDDYELLSGSTIDNEHDLISMVIVDADYRGKGLATMMYEHAIANTSNQLLSEVLSTNYDSISLQKKMGFKVIGESCNLNERWLLFSIEKQKGGIL